MPADLQTTNVLLGIMAAVSVIEAALIIAAGVALWKMSKRVLAVTDRAMTLADKFANTDLPPVIHRVTAILDDVKGISTVVREDSEWLNATVRSTADRFENVTDKMRSKTRWAAAAFRGLRFAVSAITSARQP